MYSSNFEYSRKKTELMTRIKTSPSLNPKIALIFLLTTLLVRITFMPHMCMKQKMSFIESRYKKPTSATILQVEGFNVLLIKLIE